MFGEAESGEVVTEARTMVVNPVICAGDKSRLFRRTTDDEAYEAAAAAAQTVKGLAKMKRSMFITQFQQCMQLLVLEASTNCDDQKLCLFYSVSWILCILICCSRFDKSVG